MTARHKKTKLSPTGKFRRTIYITPGEWKRGQEVASRRGVSVNRLVAMFFDELHAQSTTFTLLPQQSNKATR